MDYCGFVHFCIFIGNLYLLFLESYWVISGRVDLFSVKWKLPETYLWFFYIFDSELVFFPANFHVIFQIILKFPDIIEKSIGIFVFLADPKY